jgi:hypothetical protein
MIKSSPELRLPILKIVNISVVFVNGILTILLLERGMNDSYANDAR